MEIVPLIHKESFKFENLKYYPAQDYKSVYIWGLESSNGLLDAIYVGQSKFTIQRHLKHLSHLLMGDYWVIDAKNSNEYFEYIRKLQECNSVEEFRKKIDTYSSNYAGPAGAKDCKFVLDQKEMEKRLSYISKVIIHTFETPNEAEDKMIETYLIEHFSKYLIGKYDLVKNMRWGERRLTFSSNISSSNHTILGAVNINESREVDTKELVKFFNI
jgi:hypothetical protein